MAWSKAYTRITWVNEPSTDTPLNAANLNKMDVALNEVDNRVLQLQGSAYVHIKYSAYPAPTNIQMSDTPNVYMGICVTSEETAPTQSSAYAWNRVRGEKVMLQVDSGYIQWKYELDASWTNLLALSEIKGVDGVDGRGILSIVRTAGNGSPGTFDTFTITYTSGDTTAFQVYNGANGAKGDKGDKGDTGTGLVILGTYDSVAALQTAVASPSVGDMYNVGSSAPYNIYLWDGISWKDQGQLQGAKGDKGDKGDTGAPGADGAKGDKGDKGDTGAKGDTGEDGPNTVTTSTATNISGLLMGDGTTVKQAIAGIDYESPGTAASAVSAHNSDGGAHSDKLNVSGGTMTGKLYAQANADYTTYQVRNFALSTESSLPTGLGSLLGVYT